MSVRLVIADAMWDREAEGPLRGRVGVAMRFDRRAFISRGTVSVTVAAIRLRP